MRRARWDFGNGSSAAQRTVLKAVRFFGMVRATMLYYAAPIDGLKKLTEMVDKNV